MAKILEWIQSVEVLICAWYSTCCVYFLYMIFGNQNYRLANTKLLGKN